MPRKFRRQISEKQAVILQLLSSGGEMYGLQLIAESNGILKRGSIYVLLNRMEDNGLVKSKLEKKTPEGEQGPPRRKYRITGLGEKAKSEKLQMLRGLSKVLGVSL